MMHTYSWRTRVVAMGLLAALLIGMVITATAAGGEVSLPATTITADERNYSWLETDTQTHTYDFTDTTITTYSRDEKLANMSLRTNMIFDGETLSCKDGKTFSFGSAIFLGDDYGIQGGELAFDLAQTGGKLAVGLRLQKKAADDSKRGIWFTLDGAGNLTITAPESDLNATVAGIPTTTRMIFRDRVSAIEVLAGETIVARVAYDSNDGALTVTKSDGTSVGSVDQSTVNPAGYFTLYADSMKGTIDNLSFTHTELTRNDTVTNAPAIDYSTWVATDDRDRETPTGETVGEVKNDKQVGLFYFLCQTGDASEEPLDNTYLFNKLGYDGMKAHLSNDQLKGSYYWAEPYFGYYMNTDSWVQRKHAYMLEAAGVDFVFLDLSNGATYDQAVLSLFDTWKAIRDEGGSTPDICIMGGLSTGAVWNAVKNTIYSEEGVAKYGELFYEYKGKPLFLGDISPLDAATQKEMTDRFTIRHAWAWGTYGSTWNWLQEYEFDQNGNLTLVAGDWGHDGNGNREELALCMGHHPTSSKGRSYVGGRISYYKDFGFSLDSGAGIGFANSFQAVKQLDPDMVLVTGWNEWIAGINHGDTKDFAGSKTSDFSFVDQFNTEYSRDGEPMKLRDGDGVGFGDNYYYQMSTYIREFKGWGTTPSASGQTTIDLSNPASWDNVTPTYTDNANDTAWRSEVGYFAGYTYVNNSGRNDLLTAKVSQDAQYLYFTVNTAENVIISDDSDWMNLYIDIDADNATGWEGFDFVLNRARDEHYVSVESLKDGWTGHHVGQALYTVNGKTMTIRLDKAVIDLDGTVAELLFKWADNAAVDGNMMAFMDKGDTAPNDRYAFRYICAEGEATDTPNINYKLTIDTRDETQNLPGVPESTPTESETSENDIQSPESDTSSDTAVPPITETDIDHPVESEHSSTPAHTETETEDPGETKKGCASALSSVSILLITVMPLGIRKKKEKQKGYDV